MSCGKSLVWSNMNGNHKIEHAWDPSKELTSLKEVIWYSISAAVFALTILCPMKQFHQKRMWTYACERSSWNFNSKARTLASCALSLKVQYQNLGAFSACSKFWYLEHGSLDRWAAVLNVDPSLRFSDTSKLRFQSGMSGRRQDVVKSWESTRVLITSLAELFILPRILNANEKIIICYAPTFCSNIWDLFLYSSMAWIETQIYC